MVYHFIHLSWSDYFETMFFLLAAYWLVIGTLYYKKEFRKLVQGGSLSAGKGSPLNVDSPFEAPVQDNHLMERSPDEPDQLETKKPGDREDESPGVAGRFAGSTAPVQDSEMPVEPIRQETKRPRESEDELLYTVSRFTDEVRAYMRASARESATREELLEGLQSLLASKPYSSLGETDMRIPMNKLMAVEAEEFCQMHFTAEEMDSLWLFRKKKEDEGGVSEKEG